MRKKRNKNSGERGQAMLEVTLMMPWIFFLFVGVLDSGFYSYAAICTQNAARAAAIQTAVAVGAQKDTIACTAALNELSLMPNIVVANNTCGAAPIKVVRKTLCTQANVFPTTLTCDAPGCADCGVTNKAASSQVAVTYQSVLFVPIPGLLTTQNLQNITRVVESRIITE